MPGRVQSGNELEPTGELMHKCSVTDQRDERKGRETCIPGRGEPYDEADYKLTVQKQGGKECRQFYNCNTIVQ